MTFGRLTVLEKSSQDKHGHTHWVCVCVCGKTKIIDGGALKRGLTLSCGCLGDEKRKTSSLRHGAANTKLAWIRTSMIQRCTNPKSVSYKYYGGRGISVCEDWSNNPTSFYVWAYSNGYKDGLSIDRIDNDGNYEPRNCRWVPKKDQVLNTRKVKFLSYKGETLHISEWARRFGLTSSIISGRLKRGWSIKETLEFPRSLPAKDPRTGRFLKAIQ